MKTKELYLTLGEASFLADALQDVVRNPKITAVSHLHHHSLLALAPDPEAKRWGIDADGLIRKFYHVSEEGAAEVVDKTAFFWAHYADSDREYGLSQALLIPVDWKQRFNDARNAELAAATDAERDAAIVEQRRCDHLREIATDEGVYTADWRERPDSVYRRTMIGQVTSEVGVYPHVGSIVSCGLREGEDGIVVIARGAAAALRGDMHDDEMNVVPYWSIQDGDEAFFPMRDAGDIVHEAKALGALPHAVRAMITYHEVAQRLEAADVKMSLASWARLVWGASQGELNRYGPTPPGIKDAPAGHPQRHLLYFRDGSVGRFKSITENQAWSSVEAYAADNA